MINSYLKIAWRHLFRERSFSLINIGGMAIGMTGAILILLWVYHEWSFDRFHQHEKDLYQVYALAGNKYEEKTAVDQTAQPLGPALIKEFPDVTRMTRIKETGNLLVSVADKHFTDIKGLVVDPAFLDMFSFPLKYGSPFAGETGGGIVLITEQMEKKLFGKVSAVGRSIQLDHSSRVTIVGVLRDLPSNTRFDFSYLLPWQFIENSGNDNNWLSNNVTTFVQLHPGIRPEHFSVKIENLSRIKTGKQELWSHFVYPLRKWHLYNQWENGKPAGGRIEMLWAFSGIAFFILLIACINFMNLNTARGEKRSKDVGVRKVAGAGRVSLMAQYITEALVISFIAGLTALGLAQFTLPYFNELVKERLSVPFNNVFFWVAFLGFIFLTGLLAGSYPALYLSSFRPVAIFKKQFKLNNSFLTPRKALVIVQFTMAVILVAGTLIIRKQIMYSQERDRGYVAEGLIRVDFSGKIQKNYPLIKHELLQSGAAVSVTKTMTDLLSGGAHSWAFRWPDERPEDTTSTLTIYSADAGLVKTMGLRLLSGRDIDIGRFPSDSFSLLLNESAVQTMKLKEPLGAIIHNPYQQTNWTVVGVVSDYVQGSPYAPAAPTLIMGPGAWFNTVYIRFNPANTIAQGLRAMEMIFKKYNPAYPFEYRFVEESFASQFDNEQRIKSMAALFGALALFISCLGLFGLSAFVNAARVKEIGVRKVLGASVFNITRLLSLDILKLIVAAICLAVPITWFVMKRWLEQFSYRISPDASVFALTSVLVLVIALLTISFQTLRAATSNPAKSLRTE